MTWKTSRTAARARAAVTLALGTTACSIRILAQDPAMDDAAWGRMDGRTLNTLPPVFILRPTHFAGAPSGAGGGVATAGNKMLGRAISFDVLMSLAYDVDASRVVLPPATPAGGFDLLMTSPDASKEKLQTEIAQRLGYVARAETRPTDVLLLQAKQAGAPGLKPSQGGRGGKVSSSSSFSGGARVGVRSRNVTLQSQPISTLVKNLQGYFDKPLLDRTGLAGKYDFTLEVTLPSGGSESDAVRRALPAQLGLEVVPSREPLEVLVVQKAN
jgi:uncharacterized protein (TIGR03435 family)